MELNKIYKKGDSLIIEIPLTQRRSNPYMSELGEEYADYMDRVVGLILNEKNNCRIGFAYLIDMDYKGKDDQWTDIFYEYGGNKEEFRKLCKKLRMGIVEY